MIFLVFVLVFPLFMSVRSPSFSTGPDDGVDSECSDLMVPNVLEGNIWDHLGPYHGIYIGTIFCTP